MTNTDELDRVLRTARNLPPLPVVATKLCQMAADLDADIKEMAALISQDQALTLRLLRLANSSFYGFSGEIKTVSRAIVILGFRAVRSLALGAAVVGTPLGKARSCILDHEQFWMHSLAVASASRLLAKRVHAKEPEEVFVAGLLHDIGKLVLEKGFADSYGELVNRTAQGEATLHVLEREEYGMGHGKVALKVGERWHLPSLLAETMAFHHCPEDLDSSAAHRQTSAIIGAANGLAKIVQIGSGGDPNVETSCFSPEGGSGISSHVLCQTVAELPTEVRKAMVFLDIAPAEESEDASVCAREPPVVVAVQDPAEREIVKMTLLSMGHEPIRPEEMTRTAERSAASVVSDGAEPTVSAACNKAGIPVLDWSAWRKESGSGRKGLVNVGRLREWLTSGLAPNEPVAN